MEYLIHIVSIRSSDQCIGTSEPHFFRNDWMKGMETTDAGIYRFHINERTMILHLQNEKNLNSTDVALLNGASGIFGR